MQVRTVRRAANLLTLVSVAAILLGTLGPRDLLEPATLNLDHRFGHAALFASLGAASALRYAVSLRARRFSRSSLGVAFFGFWLLAAATELLQGPVGRHPDFTDWLADMGGAVAGFLGGSALFRLALSRAVQPDPPPAAREARTPSSPRGRRRGRARAR